LDESFGVESKWDAIGKVSTTSQLIPIVPQYAKETRYALVKIVVNLDW